MKLQRLAYLASSPFFACSPPEYGFDALPQVGIYRASVERVDQGCDDGLSPLAQANERVVIETIADGAYREIAVFENPPSSDDDDGSRAPDSVSLGGLEGDGFYARQESGPSACEALMTREFFAAVGDSIEITDSTRWDGVDNCAQTPTPGWNLPAQDCDDTRIYNFTLQESCDSPCDIQREPRVVQGARRLVPTCSCPMGDTETGG